MTATNCIQFFFVSGGFRCSPPLLKEHLVSMPFYEISMYRNMKISCCFGSIDMVGCTNIKKFCFVFMQV